MNIWARWFFLSLAVWFCSLVAVAFVSRLFPGSPFVYLFGTLFIIGILAALVFLFMLFRQLFDDEP